jgi:hypothetical protein
MNIELHTAQNGDRKVWIVDGEKQAFYTDSALASMVYGDLPQVSRRNNSPTGIQPHYVSDFGGSWIGEVADDSPLAEAVRATIAFSEAMRKEDMIALEKSLPDMVRLGLFGSSVKSAMYLLCQDAWYMLHTYADTKRSHFPLTDEQAQRACYKNNGGTESAYQDSFAMIREVKASLGVGAA